jgi:S-DNA-T family DNA segregation ATPase FtsK/SpoIIIE
MAKSTEKPKQNNLKIFWDSIKAWEFNKTHSLILGILLIVFSIALLISFTSFFLHGNEDQSSISYFFTREDKAQNWLGKTGAWLADIFIYNGFIRHSKS